MGLSVSFDDPTRAARGSRGPYHATPPTEFRKWGQVHFHHFPAFPGTCREMDLSPFFGGGLRGEWDRGSGVGMSGAERVYAMESFFGRGRDELVMHIPQCVRLGVTVVETSPCRAIVRLPWHEDLVGDPVRGVVFGGVITTLLDQASGLAVQCSLPE